MPHPLSELITARLDANENKDPHARTTITNAEAVEIRDALDETFDALDRLEVCAKATDNRVVESVIENATRVLNKYLPEVPS